MIFSTSGDVWMDGMVYGVSQAGLLMLYDLAMKKPESRKTATR